MEKMVKIISTNSVIPISVTGNYCELSCKHCNKRYLNSMFNIDDEEIIKIIKDTKRKYLLISGGTLKNGSVPIFTKLDKIKIIKENDVILNAHTGYIPEEYFLDIFLFDSISIDIVGSDRIIKEIYNLNLDLEYFYTNLIKLKEYIENYNCINNNEKNKPLIIPHITIGLYYGSSSFEEKAIDFVSKLSTEKLVLNILIPTKNTYFQNIENISIDRIVEIYYYARAKLPNTIIYLGCMRPFGEYRDKVDTKLLEIGIDGLVNPSKNLLRKIEDSNYFSFEKKDGCCALI